MPQKTQSLIQAVMYSTEKSLTPKRLNRLIMGFDSKDKDDQDNDTLMVLLSCNAYNELCLSQAQWSHVIKNSDLQAANYFGENALLYYVGSSIAQKVDLTPELKNYLLEQSNIYQETHDKRNVLNALFQDKNNIEIFSQEQIDFLVDNLKLDIESQATVSQNTKETTRQNYDEYIIGREKRKLLSQLKTTSLKFIKKDTHKI